MGVRDWFGTGPGQNGAGPDRVIQTRIGPDRVIQTGIGPIPGQNG